MSRSGNVRVSFRARPLSREEQLDERHGCLSIHQDDATVTVRQGSASHSFAFDKVFDEKTDQSAIYQATVSPLLKDFIAGRNCSVLSYGESRSGKTHTMIGPSASGSMRQSMRDDSERSSDDDLDDLSSMGSGGVSRMDFRSVAAASVMIPSSIAGRPQKSGRSNSSEHSRSTARGANTTPLHVITGETGITPRLVKELFGVLDRRKRRHNGSNSQEDPTLSMSFIAIDNEQIVDLLSRNSIDEEEQSSISVRSDRDRGVVLENTVELGCREEMDVFDALEEGLENRDKRATVLGRDNARLHVIVILKMERYSKSRGKRATSTFFLVDLADSSLVRKPAANASHEAIRDYKGAKRSLGALRKCMRCLASSERNQSPPFAESKLTKVLHPALSHGAGVSIIVTACPLSRRAHETLSAMRYGNYVAYQKTELSDHTGKPPARASSVVSKKSLDYNHSGNQSNPSRLNGANVTNGHHDAPPVDANANAKTQVVLPSYDELETAGQLLKELPEEEASHLKEGDGTKSPGELTKVSTLLESAAQRMEVDLSAAKQELKDSGFHDSMTPSQMEVQLLEVTKELEGMKYGGHLTSQIETDLKAAQEELQRLAELQVEEQPEPPPVDNNVSLESQTPIRSNSLKPITTETNGKHNKSEVESLREQLAQMNSENERLRDDQAARSLELIEAQKQIEALRNANCDGSPETALTENSRTEVSETVGNRYQLVIADQTTDTWDDKKIEVGPSPVCVCLRLRPMTKLERNRRSRSCIEVHDGGREFTVDSPLDGEYEFYFDNVFDVESSQEEVYETIGVPIVEQLLGGVNCAVMVYGLTGSGKSHTLSGKLPEMKDEDDSSDEESEATGTPTEEDAGFSPRLIADLFRGMKDAPNDVEFRLTCSYVCIYLEKMFDLLDPRFDKSLIVRDGTNGVIIEGAVEAFCFDEEDVINLIRRGAACRKLIGNKLTMDSNRSHSILTLKIEQHHIHSGRVRRSYLQLAELAGFEVTSKVKGQSVQETKIIHKSFSALGNVIKSLTEGHSYAPYRESKLTSILRDALGGNCKTTLFITASPSSYSISETINSIRLGQRVRRVTNNPRVNIDANVEEFRRWLLASESRLGELTTYVKQFANELVDADKEGKAISSKFSAVVWEAIEAIVSDEESKYNPCRKALLLDENDFTASDDRMWRSLTIELAKRQPSESLQHAMNERDQSESLLSDLQSEAVVLRRQNDLLVQEKRKMEEELSLSYRENRSKTMRIDDLDNKLAVAQHRAKEGVIFLRYLRTLCWKLRKDVEKDRPIDITEITANLHGAPDLTGLVDIDSLMMDAGFLISKETDVEKVEIEFFDYLQETGLIIDEEQVAAEEEFDELDGLDDGLGGTRAGDTSRWRKAQQQQAPRVRVDHVPDSSASQNEGDDTASKASKNTSSHGGAQSFMGLQLPWMPQQGNNGAYNQRSNQNMSEIQTFRMRNTRRERELQRDLQNMANKCVELQMELNEKRQLLDGLLGRASTLKLKKITQEATALAKERDRMMHNAKAATWKLQELHVVNKLLTREAEENKTQIKFLEEGFQKLQVSFRDSVDDRLDEDRTLRERAKALQSIVDSLTGPPVNYKDEEDDEETDDDEDSLASANPLNARVHLPLRGRAAPSGDSNPFAVKKLVDPSGPLSPRRCLLLRVRGKRSRKLSYSRFSTTKFRRKSKAWGTALIGHGREKRMIAFANGKKLAPPLFLDDVDEEDDYSADSESYYSESE